jgi:uncharacterized protein
MPRLARMLLLAAGLVASLAPAFAQNTGEQPTRTVLVLSCTLGFRHTTCDYGKPIITKIGEDSGAFTAICTEDPSLINADFLKGTAGDVPTYLTARGREVSPPATRGIDCIVFNNTTGSFLSEEQRAALVDYVSGGGALVGIHAATDAMYDWPEYPNLMGGWFDGHPWNEDVTIRVEVPDHPACEGVPERWVIADEIYQQRDWSRDKLCVLMSLDPNGTDFTKDGIKREDHDFGIAWCHNYGKGRVFYTALGHREEVFDNPIFQHHLLNGILWAMGDLPFDCQPHAKPAD